MVRRLRREKERSRGDVGLRVAHAKDGKAIAGKEEVLKADLVVMAIGQDKATGLAKAFDEGEGADLLDRAVESVLNDGLRTADIMQDGMTEVSTTAMGDAVLAALDKLAG